MTPPERDQVLAAFSLGLGRQALPAAHGALAALALAGLSLRLALPPPTTPGREWRLPDDPAPPLPDQARAILHRLLDRMDVFTARLLTPPLLAQIAATGHRLHPFDLPRLGLLLHDRALLRPAERAWLDRDGPRLDATTADNWALAPPADRVTFLQAFRGQDPAGARTLLEAVFPTETAKLRADLLQALAPHLHGDDRTFLEACTADRAANVRQTAERLLARLPGSPARTARLAAAAAAFTVETTGLLRRHARLVFKPPTQAGQPATPLEWLDQIGLTELAAALGTAADDLPDMAATDPVRQALAACALRDRRLDTAASLLRQMDPPLWPGDVAALGVAFAALPPDDRRVFAGTAYQPGAPFGVGGDWRQFCVQLGAPLGLDTARSMLASDGWRNFVARIDDRTNADPMLLPIAVLMPPSLATPFGASLVRADPLAPLLPERRPRTTLLLALLAELAALPPIPGEPPP